MTTSVTLALPLYRKMQYLPSVLQCVEMQDHPNLDVLVSDNGCNGAELRELVSTHLSRPYRYRENKETVGISEHFNQLVDEARGDYFVLLSDDDLLSSNYISALAAALDRDPEVGVAIARAERMDEAGNPVTRSRMSEDPPPIMEGLEFIRMWCESRTDFICFVTNMARTAEIRRQGGYPILEGGTSIDNALMVKLGFGRKVAWVGEALFRYRIFEESYGLALSPARLASDMKAFLRFLDEDSVLRGFAREDPDGWNTARSMITRMTWGTYRHRWRYMYYYRLSKWEWIRAAFEMPWIPRYYASVGRTVLKRGLSGIRRRLPGHTRP